MNIGHINLEKSLRGIGEHFVCLIDALHHLELRQYLLVQNVTLAKRLDMIAGVTVGPVVTTAITAACCLPHVDIVHIHHPAAVQSGLILTLTRSMPFVLTHRGPVPGLNPVTQSAYRRAAAVVCADDDTAAALLDYDPCLRIDVVPDATLPACDTEAYAGCRSAALHLEIYRRAAAKWRMPSLMV